MLFVPKIYVAAAFSKRLEATNLAEALEDRGFEVTSRWLVEKKPEGADYEKYLEHEALMDVNDVLRSDLLVRITDTEELQQEVVNSKLITGSRFFEMGMAYAKGIPIIVVGGNQCLFDRLPSIKHFENTTQLFEYLNMYEGE